MSGNDGENDNVTKIKGGKEPSAIEKAMAVVEKARKEAFENKMKEKVKLLVEAERSVKLIRKEMEQMQRDFEEGV